MKTNLYKNDKPDTFDEPVDQQLPGKEQLRAEPELSPHHRLQEPVLPEYTTPVGMRREEFRAMGTTISN